MPPATDPALDALFLPFHDRQLAWPSGKVLFLRARAGSALQSFAASNLVCEQSFKPHADALRAAGFDVIPDEAPGRFALVLVLLPRQREEARALLARAVTQAAAGGCVVASLANTEGARSGETDLAQLAGPVSSLSKHKCRVFWTAPRHEQIDDALRTDWMALDAPRPIADGRYASRPGLFAWNRIDPASALLAAQLPPSLRGVAADLGAGFGYLSGELLQRCAGITHLHCFEAEARALALARQNLQHLAPGAPLEFHWHDVTQGLPARYDVIVTNPPFHAQGSTERPDIGRRFIAAAAGALRPEGQLWLVANRHLPYETVLTQAFGAVRTVVQRDGFKVIVGVKRAGTR